MYFTVGQKVKSLDTNLAGNRIKGSIYTVLHEYTCSCGTQFIAWGPEVETVAAESIMKWQCLRCHSPIINSGYYICVSTNFELVHEDSLLIAYHKTNK